MVLWILWPRGHGGVLTQVPLAINLRVLCVQVGTPDYYAPEFIQAKRKHTSFSQAIDYWALGCLVYDMLYGYLPFESESSVKTESLILSHQVCCVGAACSVITRVVIIIPRQRWSSSTDQKTSLGDLFPLSFPLLAFEHALSCYLSRGACHARCSRPIGSCIRHHWAIPYSTLIVLSCTTQTTLRFPPNAAVTEDALSFMKSLLCDVKERRDYAQIRRHAFLSSIDWAVIDDSSIPTDIPDQLEPRKSRAVAPPRQPMRVLSTQVSRPRAPPPKRVFA